jgi:hypothetical protein
MVLCKSFEKRTMTISKGQDNSIPQGYEHITVPNEEEFYNLLSDCRLENDGDQLHIHIPSKNFNTLIRLFHIMILSGYIE